jgi:hypothetical protein
VGLLGTIDKSVGNYQRELGNVANREAPTDFGNPAEGGWSTPEHVGQPPSAVSSVCQNLWTYPVSANLDSRAAAGLPNGSIAVRIMPGSEPKLIDPKPT